MDELRTQGFRQEELPQIEEVELPLAVPVRSAQRLQVSSICWDADARRARFRLECAQAGACLPFLAYVHVASRALAASCRMTSPQHVSQPKLAPAVHAGARVTAVLATAGMRMTLPVTCLDRGALGEVIRVRGHEGRIFRARVTGPAQVEASLP